MREYERLAATRGPHVKPPPALPPKLTWYPNAPQPNVPQAWLEDAGDDAAAATAIEPDGGAPVISRASSGFSARRLLDAPRDQFDWALFLVTAGLAVIGVVNLYSATSVVRASLSDLYVQQVYWLVAGGILARARRRDRLPPHRALGYALYGFGVVLLLLVFVLGRDIRGSSRWIQIGSFSLQPSEFMKLFLIIALAKYLHDDPKSEGRTLRDLVVPAAIAALPVALVLRQPDLGTALILLLIFASIALMMRIQWRSLAWLGAFLGISGPLVWSYLLKPYQKQRILSFLNPEENILGANWHAHHARVAIGSGRILGEGFMRGTQNQFLFLPDQYTDFPFPVFAEDWGFVGCLVLGGALRVPGFVGHSHRAVVARPLRRRARRGRLGAPLLARVLQPRHGHRHAPGRRRDAAALFVRRLERHDRDDRPRALDERVDAPLPAHAEDVTATRATTSRPRRADR